MPALREERTTTARAPAPASRALAELMDQICRLNDSASFVHGLNPAQWAALRFFAAANPQVRTTTAFARYHATTKGTASKSVRALERKGYLTRERSVHDGRAAILEVTERGRRLLREDPLDDLARCMDDLSEAQRFALAEALETVARTLLATYAPDEANGAAGESPTGFLPPLKQSRKKKS
jgi:DNA-binding MarR family transcriptional regulator